MWQSNFFSEQYQDLLNVPVKEFVNLCRGLERQEVSTQHGVKGEGMKSFLYSRRLSEPWCDNV